MAQLTYPDKSVHEVNASNESEEFNNYVAIARAQGQQVDLTATSQAFEMATKGESAGAFSPIPVQTTALGDLSLGIVNSLPAPVANLWTDSSNAVVSSSKSVASAAKTAGSYIADKSAELAQAGEAALGVSATILELGFVAVAAVAVFGVFYLWRHPAARAALL